MSMAGPSDCDEILNAYGKNTSGAYFIYPDAGMGPVRMHVWCDMDTDGGGWTVRLVHTFITTNINIDNNTLFDFK